MERLCGTTRESREIARGAMLTALYWLLGLPLLAVGVSLFAIGIVFLLACGVRYFVGPVMAWARVR